MAIAKIQGAQRDFSAGQLDVAMKRADDNPVMKTGLRQAGNTRILNAKAIQNRPGRRALFKETGRVEEVLMSPGNTFFLCFGAGTLRVYNSAGTQVFTQSGFAWTVATAHGVVWAVYDLAIYITFTGQQPQVLTWDGTATWSVTGFAEATGTGAQKRTMFYRISTKGVTLALSGAGQVGTACTATFSSAIMVAGHVGTRIRYVGRQLLITAIGGGGTTATVTVEETIAPTNIIPLAADPRTVFSVGDVVVGTVSGGKGIVTAVGATSIHAQPLSTATQVSTSHELQRSQDGVDGIVPAVTVSTTFLATDVIVGPAGSIAVNAGVTLSAQEAVTVWDEEVMNVYRGWPQAVFVDQGRVGFCNFPALPRAIAWSAIGNPNDLYPEALPQSAILELVPGKSQVLYVVPGMESAELVFCDNAVHYIPITATNPLKPGSVAFNQISLQGSGTVQPRAAEQTIVYVKAGGAQIGAIQVPGTYNRPYVVDDISELHSSLFDDPVAIAIPAGSTQYEESYAYVLNDDGTLAVGKFNMKNGLIDAGPDGAPRVGWVPWSGAGTVSWVAALNADVVFTTSYAPNGVTAVSVVEMLDDTEYLDGAISVNSLPTPFVVGGKGPLYAFPGPGATVTLIDQATRMMGTYTVDANGNIIAQGNGGENLSIASLVSGQPWTMTVEPFVPDAPPGQDIQQRMRKRRVSRFAAYVSNSTGFLMARLFSGPLTRTSPVLGTIMNTHRVTAWNQDDDATAPPPLREEAQRWRPLGRSFDPRVAIIKDTPGPLVLHEISIEAST